MARNPIAPGGYIGGEPPRRPMFNQLSGVWKLDDVLERQRNNSWANALGVEDVFSTWLYTGNGSTQTITNGIDLAGNGGLVWIKRRGPGSGQNALFDTARGANNYLRSNGTGAQNDFGTYSDTLTAFSGTGFSLGADASLQAVNSVTGPGDTYASWTFRKAAKFFDVVTYTGIGSARTIAHNLGSVPGCIIVKRTDGADAWFVYHRSTGAFNALLLNATDAAFGNNNYWNNTAPTSSVFSVGTDPRCNASGGTYVAYLFAHDAGGFGDSGNDSVVKCGSFVGTGPAGGQLESLGWEPQWLLVKRADSTSDWEIYDSMRGFVNGSQVNTADDARLRANLSNAEDSWYLGWPASTGFQYDRSGTYIYIAIRRGPMKTPTDATKVFDAEVVSESTTGPNYTNTITSNFPVDWVFTTTSATTRRFGTRLTAPNVLQTNSTSAEANYGSGATVFASNTSAGIVGTSGLAGNAYMYAFRRAPGFFDVVAFTGVYASTAYSHNLGVTPEMIILKRRSNLSDWIVYHTGVPSPLTNQPALNLTGGYYANSYFSASPTSTQFSAQYLYADNWVAYLFATCPGVSKVGSYTGTGTTLSVDCGFTNGARFVMIKRTDTTGDWYVWDTARGIVSGNDPSLLLNSTAAEVTNTDYIDPYSFGFEISSTAPAAINANGGSYIFLAIA